MRNFLETFPTVRFRDLYTLYPEYFQMFNEIELVGEEIKKGTSIEVEEQYEQIIDTLDSILLTTETIDKYNKLFPSRNLNKEILLSEKKDITLEERETIESELELEIEEMMKDVDTKIIDKLVPKDEPKEQITYGEEQISRTIDDIDEEDRFIGISYKYTSLNKLSFEKSLSMISQGCKFYYTTFGAKHFVLFKLEGMGRIIIETSEEKRMYNEIFLPNNQELNVYFLNEDDKKLVFMSTLFSGGFATNDPEPTVLNDIFLYNTNYIYLSYEEDILWKEADLVQQPKGIILRDKTTTEYFSLYNPLESICTLEICKTIYSKVNVDRDAKGKIESSVLGTKYKIEGIGMVNHSSDILSELLTKSLIDINYKPTPLGEGVLLLNGYQTNLVLPQFRPFTYYMNDLESKVKNSKNKYYSIFNGVTLYHTKKDVKKIDFAITLNTSQVNLWGVTEAEQVNSFPISWQQEQNFKEYVEYLPFSANGKLRIRTMDKDRKDKDKVVFRDVERANLNISCIENNNFDWTINAQNYRYIINMYGEENVRILGKLETRFSTPDFFFFLLVNKNNDILAVLPALTITSSSTKVEVDNDGRAMNEEIVFNTQYVDSVANQNPLPLWDVSEMIIKLEKKYPKFILEGKYTNESEDITTETKEDILEDKVAKKDVIIDFDNLETPLIIEEKGLEESESTGKPEKSSVKLRYKLLKDIFSDFKASFPSSLKAEQGEFDIISEDKWSDDNEVRYSTRYLGNWSLPEDGDEDYEDYDYEELDRDDYKKFSKKFKDWVDTKDWSKKVDTSLEVSEKNWLEFIVRIKK